MRVLYRIDGVTYPESTIVDAFRAVVQRMKKDMRAVTSGISAKNFDPLFTSKNVEACHAAAQRRNDLGDQRTRRQPNRFADS